MKRPVVYLTLGDNSPTTVFQSKIGGKPYLPIGAKYPKNRKTGNPLVLLAQINFAEMPPMPDFPTQGILQFFIDKDDDNYGKDFDESISYEAYSEYEYEDLYARLFKRIGYDVIYYPEILPENQLQTDFSHYPTYDYNHEYGNYDLIGGEFPITFQPVIEEKIGEMEEDTTNGHKINGNAGFAQGDEIAWIFDEGWWRKHTLLFQLDSELNKETKKYKVLWGDLGIANFFIRPEDLKNLDFSKVIYCWAGG